MANQASTKQPSKAPKRPPSSAPRASSPGAFADAVAIVAVAQICAAGGFRKAEPSALRALADVAGRYARELAGTALSVANSAGRTEANILDFVGALEETAARLRGFAGGSVVSRPALQSRVVRELADYVSEANGVPFVKPVVIKRSPEVNVVTSFAMAGKEPPAHVPSWLPCFPLQLPDVVGKEMLPSWEDCERDERIVAAVDDAQTMQNGRKMIDVPTKRERVKFKIEVMKKRNLRRKIQEVD